MDKKSELHMCHNCGEVGYGEGFLENHCIEDCLRRMNRNGDRNRNNSYARIGEIVEILVTAVISHRDGQNTVPKDKKNE